MYLNRQFSVHVPRSLHRNPDISKQSSALPLRRSTRLCLQLSGSPVRIPRLRSLGVKLAGVKSPPESSRICQGEMPAAPALRPQMLETRAASRLARQSARKRLEQGPSGRWRLKHKMGGARLSEHGWAGLSDPYEPYLFSKEMSGNNDS